MKKIAIGLILTLALISCSKKGAEQKGPFLAKVGNTTITQADYDKEFKSLPEYAQQLFAAMSRARKNSLMRSSIKRCFIRRRSRKAWIKTPDFQKKAGRIQKDNARHRTF